MKRPVPLRFSPMPLAALQHRDHRSRLCGLTSGYTLVEILVATTLSLLLLGAVIQIFGSVSEGITDSRSMLESADRLRVVQARLQQDLSGITVTMNPPCRPEDNAGYFEYIEGPITQANASGYAVDSENGNTPDTTIGDFDDILMFTTRSTGRPFVGRVPVAIDPSQSIQSDVAEVAWFLRGRTLYRRVLLVAPALNNLAVFTGTSRAGFYAYYDISVRPEGANVLANTLGDLTQREHRFAHLTTNPADFPYDARLWRWECQTTPTGGTTFIIPTLPTLLECSTVSVTGTWTIGTTVPPLAAMIPDISYLDLWTNDTSKRVTNSDLFAGADGPRIADDVILTNVIGFDVKVWDSVVQGYVDLGYNGVACGVANVNSLGHLGHLKSDLDASTIAYARTYDTWSTQYESVGTGLTGWLLAGNGINGFDDAGEDINRATTTADGIVDSYDERITSPPYPVPLRGIQVKIRVFEPDSRQIREVTVVQDFLPQ